MYTDLPLQQFDMGYSRKEFDGVMHLQGSFPFEAKGPDGYLIQWEDSPVLLQLGEEQVRRIASMQMSQLPVSIDLTALATEQRKAFLKVFFKSFLKGGG